LTPVPDFDPLAAAARQEGSMSTIVVVHGAWGGGWAWRKMRAPLRAHSHELFTPTLTGLGERAHLLTRQAGLGMHIADVVAAIEFEDLRDVMLVGHSYGGMVVTGVANRLPGRIARLVYLDAFVPKDGECVYDLLPPAMVELTKQRIADDGWRLMPSVLPPDTPDDDRRWMEKRRLPQAILTHTERISLTPGVPDPQRSYIYCTRIGPHDTFGPFAQRAKSDPSWRYHEIDASHGPHITAPDALAVLFDRIAAQ
jgi:pimeloyl-ACP methyl ester carboxylesterase